MCGQGVCCSGVLRCHAANIRAQYSCSPLAPKSCSAGADISAIHDDDDHGDIYVYMGLTQSDQRKHNGF